MSSPVQPAPASPAQAGATASSGTATSSASPRGRASRAPRSGTGQGRAGVLTTVVMAILCLVWTIPTLGLFITSLRNPADALSTGWWTVIKSPLGLTMDNYQQVISNSTGAAPTSMANAFVNSLAVAIPATVLPILIAAFAAYAFTFIEFRGRDALFIIIVGLLVVPNQVAFVPMFKIYNQLGLNGQFLGIWMLHAGFGMPLAIFILRNYMATLPTAVVESAKIDGAGHFTTFWRLIMPMSIPALASFAIFQFLWVWNDYIVALIFLGQGDKSVMTVNLAALQGNQGQGWQLITAGAFMTMLLPMIVFLSLQRFFIRGMTSGAVKG